MDTPRAARESNAVISLCEFCSYDAEATVIEKSSTYDRQNELGGGSGLSLLQGRPGWLHLGCGGVDAEEGCGGGRIAEALGCL